MALQLGGSDPRDLAASAGIGKDFGCDEINLNVGYPSDRVKDRRFGACLMAEPELVAACVAAMKRTVAIPVTVKCRIGIDEQDPEAALDALARAGVAGGADVLIVHARKAWLNGLSPKENRDSWSSRHIVFAANDCPRARNSGREKKMARNADVSFSCAC